MRPPLPVEVARLELHAEINRYLLAHHRAARALDRVPLGTTRSARARKAEDRYLQLRDERDRAYEALPLDLAKALRDALTRAEQDAP